MPDDFIIYPYMEIDGRWTLTDDQVMRLHDRIIHCGHDEILCDGTIDTREKFLSAMKHDSKLFVVFAEKLIPGILWLNRFEGRTARIHYCGFNVGGYRDKIRFAKHAIKTILHIKNTDGTFAVDVLVGHTPASLKRAVRFIGAVGGIKVGKIPFLSWNGKTGKSEDGIISYFTRGEAYENL